MDKRKSKKKKQFKPMDLKCPFKGPAEISYKDVYRLKKFITTRGRIISPERTGVCPRCQKKLSKEIKKARFLALLPYCNYS